MVIRHVMTGIPSTVVRLGMRPLLLVESSAPRAKMRNAMAMRCALDTPPAMTRALSFVEPPLMMHPPHAQHRAALLLIVLLAKRASLSLLAILRKLTCPSSLSTVDPHLRKLPCLVLRHAQVENTQTVLTISCAIPTLHVLSVIHTSVV